MKKIRLSSNFCVICDCSLKPVYKPHHPSMGFGPIQTDCNNLRPVYKPHHPSMGFGPIQIDCNNLEPVYKPHHPSWDSGQSKLIVITSGRSISRILSGGRVNPKAQLPPGRASLSAVRYRIAPAVYPKLTFFQRRKRAASHPHVADFISA